MNIDQAFLLFFGIIFSLGMMMEMYGTPKRRRRNNKKFWRKNKNNNFHYNWKR